VPRLPTDILTEREAQIMDVLWRRGEALADQVREELPGRPHDSTVRTLLRILETKGFVAHETRGKSYVYRPAIERAQAQRSALRNFLGRLFEGSAESLVLRLVEDEVLTPQQLEQIRKAAQSRSPRRRQGGSR
jgi:BlaI family penicillinase repressor